MDRFTSALGVCVLIAILVVAALYLAKGNDSKLVDSVKSAIWRTDQTEKAEPEATSGTERVDDRTSQEKEEKPAQPNTRSRSGPQ